MILIKARAAVVLLLCSAMQNKQRASNRRTNCVSEIVSLVIVLGHQKLLESISLDYPIRWQCKTFNKYCGLIGN